MKHSEHPHKRKRHENQQRHDKTALIEHSNIDQLCGEPSVGKKGNPHRASAACATCRIRKVKCDEGLPVCSFCLTRGFSCEYERRSAHSRDLLLEKILGRLIRVESTLCNLKLANLEEAQTIENGTTWKVSQTGVVTPSSTPNSAQFSVIIPPTGQTGDDELADGFNALHSPPDSSVDINEASNNSHKNLRSFADVAVQRSRYLDRTPFSCEERRLPLPEICEDVNSVELSDVKPLLESFFQRVLPLFPIICDRTAFAMAEDLVAQGFQKDLQSCLIYLMISLSKAYESPFSVETGIAEFQKAIGIISHLGLQFTLEHAQAQVFAALFLLKKGRLLNFWSYLHAGCAVLYTLIQLDEPSSKQMSPDDIKTTRRLYWICYNLERDLYYEAKQLQRSSLSALEENLSLPLGCDETLSAHLKGTTRETYAFFLAEMSLKSILARIHAKPAPQFSVQKSSNGAFESSPILLELKLQLDTWHLSLPDFLGWSTQPQSRTISPVATRLKLTYWFARYSIFIPLINQVLEDESYQLPFLGWSFFQEGVLAGLSMVTVAITEESDIDVLSGNRLLSTICLLQRVLAKGWFSDFYDESKNDILKAGIELLWNQLALKSEWMACRLHAL